MLYRQHLLVTKTDNNCLATSDVDLQLVVYFFFSWSLYIEIMATDQYAYTIW